MIFRGIGSRIYNISLLSEFSEPDRPSAEVKKPETAPMPEMEKMVRVIKAPSAKIEYSATDKYGITLGTTADDVLAKRGRVIRTITKREVMRMALLSLGYMLIGHMLWVDAKKIG